MKPLAMLLVAFSAFVGLAHSASAQMQSFEVNVTVRGHAEGMPGSWWDQFLVFSAPVEVPGVVLAPNRAYLFRFIPPSVIQVLDEHRSVYAAFLVTSTWRRDVTDDYAVTLRRVRSDAPPRIGTVFPPDSSMGYTLSYPND